MQGFLLPLGFRVAYVFFNANSEAVLHKVELASNIKFRRSLFTEQLHSATT